MSNFFAELGRTTYGIAVPERHFPWLAGSRRNDHAIVRNFFDAPGRGAENDGVASAAFEHHFFIEFADTRTFGSTGEKNAIHAAIGDRAAVDDGNLSRALAGGEFIGQPIPSEARAQLREIVRGIAAGEHIEKAFECSER